MRLNASLHLEDFVKCHTTSTVRNKHEKLEGKEEASFDTPFMIQNHAENRKKNCESPLGSTS